jgi:3-oxoacyl-[acyl-carrier protein] reductase
MRLEDTAVVVTGAAHGIGRAMAGGFVREGARVAALDIDVAALTEAVAGFDGAGQAKAFDVDVRDPTAIESVVERARRAHGPAEVLVNNAGVKQLTVTGEEHPTWAVDVDTWDTVVGTNLHGAFYCARAVLPAMLDRDAGRLIHVTSGHGRSARVRRAPYVASKFGLEGFHRTLARELAATGVDSIAFAPPGGGVRTREADVVDDPSALAHDPAVVVEPAIQLVAGAGENGDRYQGTADGEGLERTHAELG